ncbi:hypothetical protein [Intestinibacter bartlettii]|uniref:hypothetical protein n=1 Tax=Intestinibacter bartlettii TaxID=261299 RepID=UPI0039F4DA4B
MKKQYSKPGIIIDDFSITQNIASCGYAGGSQYNHSNPEKCTWKEGDAIIFSSNFIDCIVGLEPGTGLDGIICYNNPDGVHVAFGSY